MYGRKKRSPGVSTLPIDPTPPASTGGLTVSYRTKESETPDGLRLVTGSEDCEEGRVGSGRYFP